MTKITTELHDALMLIVRDENVFPETLRNRLELMGLISPYFGSKWKVTDIGMQYLTENVESK